MIKNFVIIFTLFTVLNSQDFTVEEIVNRVAITPRPSTSITEVKLEITRFKRNKEKVKVREFTRFQKFYYNVCRYKGN